MSAGDSSALVGVLAFAGLLGLRVLGLRRQGVRANVLGRDSRGPGRWLEWFILPAAGFSAIAILLHALHAPFHLAGYSSARLWTRSSLVEWTGILVLFGALLLLAKAFRDLGSSYRLGVDTQQPGGLVTSGVFRRSRNPVYLSVDGFYLGIFLMYPYPFFLGLCLGVLVALHAMILREERHLKDLLGAEYAAYRRQVRRYF